MWRTTCLYTVKARRDDSPIVDAKNVRAIRKMKEIISMMSKSSKLSYRLKCQQEKQLKICESRVATVGASVEVFEAQTLMHRE